MIERVDENILSELYSKHEVGDNLKKLLDIAYRQDFASFDLQNKKAIINHRDNPHYLQFVNANYGHIPTEEETEELVNQTDFRVLSKEIKSVENEVKENKEKTKKDIKELSDLEKKFLRYVQWAMRIRDERRIYLNKIQSSITL